MANAKYFGKQLLFEFYAKIPQRIIMIENRTKHLVKAELEYLRSHNREVLGTRIQTSNVSDITFSAALENIEIEQAVDGNGGCLKHIAVRYIQFILCRNEEKDT